MRRRISWLVLATTSTVVASFVIPLCLLVQTLAADRAMAAADQEARNVAIIVASLDGTKPGQLRQVVAGLGADRTPRTWVLTAGGRSLGSAGSMDDDPEVVRALAGEAFTVVDDAGGRVLLPVVVADGTAVVRTEVSSVDLRRGVTQAWLGIIGLGLLLLGASWVIAARLGRRISRPLLGVAEVAHQLRAGDLSARAHVTGTEETQELARALNGLAERTGELLAAERAAVADLSHRLRTPVTALRLDAEAVEQPELANRLQAHIAALQRTVDAIVKEARRPVRTDLTATSDAVSAIAGRVAFWSALADDQGRSVRVELAEGPLLVALAAEDLVDLVDILIDNVFAHTPDTAGLAVVVHAEDQWLDLVVRDEGPGLAATEREARPGTTGLGLDIVERTATSAGGSLAMSSDAGGTTARVRLPLVPH